MLHDNKCVGECSLSPALSVLSLCFPLGLNFLGSFWQTLMSVEQSWLVVLPTPTVTTRTDRMNAEVGWFVVLF